MKKELKFIVFSDAHLRTPCDAGYLKMLEEMKSIAEAGDIDALISLGDMPAMLGRERHASNEDIKQFLHNSMNNAAEYTGLPVFAINGNHDAVGTDFFLPELWNSAVGGQFAHGMDVHDGDSVYYYVDYPENALRLIFLSLPYGSDLEAEYPTPLWGFGDRQLKWLAEKALTVPEEYDVLLFCHVPAFYEHPAFEGEEIIAVFDGERARQSKVSALCGWIADRDSFVEIMNAFADRESDYVNAALNISASYSGVGRLIAQISGHTHRDQLFMPNEDCIDKESPTIKNPLKCPQVVVRNAITNEEHGYAFDLITVRSDRVTLSRYGDGESRTFII